MTRSRIIGLIVAALVAMGIATVATPSPAEAYTIENRMVTKTYNGQTVTMYYEQKVQSGNDQFRPYKYVLDGVPSGTTYAYVYALAGNANYNWLADNIDNCTGSTCVWEVTPTTWAPLEGTGTYTNLYLTMSGGLVKTWALGPNSGGPDPGGRPVIPSLTQDFVKHAA